MLTEGTWIGRSAPRREDHRFLTGTGGFVDDLQFDGMLHGLVVRSMWAHGCGLRIDAADALRAPGVRLILTAAALAETGLTTIPVDLPPPGQTFDTWRPQPQPILCADEVRHVGDLLCFVVADTLAQAQEAAERLQVEIEQQPARLDLAEAPAEFVYEEGDAAAAELALAQAAQVVEATLRVHRVDALPLEPRGCVGAWRDGVATLHVSTQRVQILHRALADRVFRLPRERVRVVAPDTGGGFGQKNGLYPEYVLCLEAARRLQRPVKWIPHRSEGLAAGCHARDNLFHLSVALDADKRISAVQARRILNLGAYTSSRSMVPVQNGLTHLTGVYAIPVAHVRVSGVLTHTAPTCSYRGAGRPENVYACERLIDLIARKLGRDPIAFRRDHLVGRDRLPWTSPLGTEFTTQDFAGLLERALLELDHASFADRRAAAAAEGRLRGFGVCLFAEDLHGSDEPIPARIEWSGERFDVVVGVGSAGHGHETTFLQIAAERLGVPMDKLGFCQSDTAAMPEGVGTAASWSTTLGGSSVRLAADAAVEAARNIAVSLLEASAADITFDDGLFRVVGANRFVGWDEILAAEPKFAARAVFTGKGRNVPAGCHACELEVDPETGEIVLLSYAIAQDSGILINPMIHDGQLHGGAAQGVGQSWFEQILYDGDTGQLVSGSLTDYALPRAADLPPITIARMGVNASDNPLGVKGVGEAAATGAPAAFANAVHDALWPARITDLQPPFTPVRVWRALRNASLTQQAGREAEQAPNRLRSAQLT